MSATPHHLTITWLARSSPCPDKVREQWESEDIALLLLGERLAAVRIPGALVHAALGTEAREELAVQLRERLNGAVIHDVRPARGPTFYALIPGHAGMVWDLETLAPCLGDGVYLGVPHPRRVEPPGIYWIVPPSYEGDLCRPQSVRDLLRQGAACLDTAATV